MLSNVVLPVFFLYFVLISGYCSSLLNCGLQRFMRDSVYFKHILIILSIYIFTFILNWYTFDSLAIGQENFESESRTEEDILSSQSLRQLGVWFVYTIIIYLIFIISTKSEVTFIIIFFTYTVISIILQIIIKSVSSSSYNRLSNKLFITKNDYTGRNQQFVIICHNLVTAGFVVSMSLLIVGFYQYFKRQYKDHAHHWNTNKFIFGTSKCRDA